MKGIVLAGGTGSRLFPLTKVTNKHLLPVGHYPMIFHAIGRLAEAKVQDVMVVTGTEHMGDVVGVLGSGHRLDLNFTYRVQDQAGGIAQALGLAEGFVGDDRCIVILGDNILEDSIAPLVERFRLQDRGAKVLLKEVPDPSRFGVPELDGERVVRIDEKPADPQSPYAVTGIYMYDASVFEHIKRLKPSRRGELEITDVNNAYVEAGTLTFEILTGWWTDAGTHDSLAHAQQLAAGLVFELFEKEQGYGARAR